MSGRNHSASRVERAAGRHVARPLAAVTSREIACVAVLTAGALGWLSSRQDAPKLALVVLVSVAFGVAVVRRPGLAIGVALVGVLNGLPGVDTAATFVFGLALRNYCAYLLVAVLAVQALRTRGLRRAGTYDGRLLIVLGCLIAAWWFVTVVRSESAG